MAKVTVNSIGEYIREQREQAKISMRQLAQSAGVSNPYLSQIERGLRKPSADILQQIAKGLRISAEALYVQAGILEDRPADSGVRSALLADTQLSERQKQVLIEIYESFRRENATASQAAETAPAELTAGRDLEGEAAGAPGAEAMAMEAALAAAAEDQAAGYQAAGEAEDQGAEDEAAGYQGAGYQSGNIHAQAQPATPGQPSMPGQPGTVGEPGTYSQTVPPTGPNNASD